MKRLDEDLKIALGRKQPSSNFVDDVMTRINASSKPDDLQPLRLKLLSRVSIFKWPKWSYAVAFATVLISFGSFFYYQHEQRRINAEIAAGKAAKEQLMLAMRITSNKFNKTRNKVLELTQQRNIND